MWYTFMFSGPHPVAMLREAEITTNTLTLEWEQKEVKPDYSYVVNVTNRSFYRSENAFTTTHTVSGLQSGTNYSFTVTTQTADGTLAAPVTNSYFTRMRISSHKVHLGLYRTFSCYCPMVWLNSFFKKCTRHRTSQRTPKRKFVFLKFYFQSDVGSQVHTPLKCNTSETIQLTLSK